MELSRLTVSLIGQYVVHLMQVAPAAKERLSWIISEINRRVGRAGALDEDFDLAGHRRDYAIERFSGGVTGRYCCRLRIVFPPSGGAHRVHESTL